MQSGQVDDGGVSRRGQRHAQGEQPLVEVNFTRTKNGFKFENVKLSPGAFKQKTVIKKRKTKTTQTATATPRPRPNTADR